MSAIPYITIDDLIARFPESDILQLTDDRGNDTVNATAVDAAINDATATVNSYLRGRYVIPLTAVPDDLVRITADIARYNLSARLGGKMDETIQALFDNAIRTLIRIQDGKMILIVDPALPIPIEVGFIAVINKRCRALPPDTLRRLL